MKRTMVVLLMIGLFASSISALAQVYDNPDPDGDELLTEDEIRIGTDPNNPDSDGDGIPDGEEDLDGDGLTNAYELNLRVSGFEYMFEVDNPDTDGDGILDGQDDYDNDGLSNAEEARRGTIPALADSDNDGFLDGEEVQMGLDPNEYNLPHEANTDTASTAGSASDAGSDGDSGSDSNSTGDTDGESKDSDGDGISDDTEIRIGTDPNKAEAKEWMKVYLKLLQIDPRYAKLYKAFYSPNPDFLVVSDQGGSVALFSVADLREQAQANETDLASGTVPVVQPEPLVTVNTGTWVEGMALTPDDSVLATAGENGVLSLWDTASGTLLAEQRFNDRLVSVAISPVGDVVAAGTNGGQVYLLALDGGLLGDEIAVLPAGGPVWNIAFSPDGSRLAYADGSAVSLWDVAAGTGAGTLTGHSEQVWALAFDPLGERLASGSWDGAVIVWDTASDEQLLTLTGHTHYVGALAFTNDGTALASGSGDTSVRLWDAASGDLLRTIDDHADQLGGVAFHHTDNLLLTASWDGVIFLWGIPGEHSLLTDEATAADSAAANNQPETGTSPPTAAACTASVTSNANLRGGPGTDFARVGSVAGGDTVQVTGVNAAGDWYALAVENIDSAWIAGFLISPPDCPDGEMPPVVE